MICPLAVHEIDLCGGLIESQSQQALVFVVQKKLGQLQRFVKNLFGHSEWVVRPLTRQPHNLTDVWVPLEVLTTLICFVVIAFIHVVNHVMSHYYHL